MKKSKSSANQWSDRSLALHKKLAGKIRIESATPVRNRNDLSLVYTPGVGAVSAFIAKNPSKAREYTMKGRMVAVVSDGSAVLGLGNIGAEASLPVMEGKAALFKTLGGVDAVPIVLATQDAHEIIETVVRIAPGFGGINLEDIAAPKCFEIERKLKERLTIPVMHDDQHGTAIVVLAALLNALKVVKKSLARARIVIVGAGAAGGATAQLLAAAGATNLLVLDREGLIAKTRADLTPFKRELALLTNIDNIRGGVAEALTGADAVIGVSGPGSIAAVDIKRMAAGAIVFALANPVPEIMPDQAIKAGAAIVATGRSDFPNQVNNALVFPGVFKGALANKVVQITDAMKLKAAKSLASLVAKPSAQKIIPDVFDKRVAVTIAKAIR